MTNTRDRLATRYDELVAGAVVDLEEQAAALPTKVHEEVMDLLDEILTLLTSSSEIAVLSTAARSLKRLRPVFVRELAKANPETLVKGLHEIARRLERVGSGDGAERDDASDQSDRRLASGP